MEINIDKIQESLLDVNNFASEKKPEVFGIGVITTSRRTSKSSTFLNADPSGVLMYEIYSDGRESLYKNMSLRELLHYLNAEVHAIDCHYVPNVTEHAKTLDSSLKIDSLRASGPLYPLHSEQRPIIEETTEAQDYSVICNLRLRDLRRLDFKFNPSEEKSVLIRRHTVLMAMDPLRAVIMANRLILIVPDGADSLISVLDQHMKEWSRGDNKHPHKNNDNDEDDFERHHNNIHGQSTKISFESHAYEALLTTVKAWETQIFQNLEESIQEVLTYFKKGSLLPIEIQEKMRTLKNELSVTLNRTVGSKNVLQAITEDDEEMALMNLSLLKRKPKLYTYPLVPEIMATHDEMEELLESYLIDFSSLETKMNYLRSQIQSAEDLVSLRLDTSRNELLIANTALAVLACSIAFSAYITGVFGMNLDNATNLEPIENLFYVITSLSFVLIFILFFGMIMYLKATGMFPSRIQYNYGKKA